MNIYEQTALEAAILSQDVGMPRGMLDEIASMIDQNPFFERIRFLLANQDLAKKPVKNVAGEFSPPNCIGTAFFIAGVGPFDYPYHAYGNELSEHMEQQPGSGRWDDAFSGHPERKIPGAFIFSYSVESDDWHAGIYLGTVGDEHILFAQHGHGESFGPELESRNYCSPSYYIPKTLLKNE